MKQITAPRHDFYQTDSHVIVSLYIKGYGGPEIKDQVEVKYEPIKITVTLPKVGNGEEEQRFSLEPLFAAINPDQSTARILSTKIELKLAKAYAMSWSSIIHSGDTAGPTAPGPSAYRTTRGAAPSSAQLKKDKRNWDRVVDEELKDDDGAKDPNAGGDAALKDFFSKLYKDADDDTRRAMIKSYTESGGTTLSTNWDEIGKGQTPIHPPEGMEARKY